MCFVPVLQLSMEKSNVRSLEERVLTAVVSFGHRRQSEIARYIDADELKELRDKYIRGEVQFDDEYDLIDKCPTIDVVPAVYGRWVHLGGDEWCCSACGFIISTEGSWEKPTQKYCEDCGAKIEGESI